MGKIVVAKLYRLGKDGDKFSEQFKTPVRERVVIDEDYIKKFNANKQTRGQMYEVDQKATKERDAEIEKQNGGEGAGETKSEGQQAKTKTGRPKSNQNKDQ